MVQLHEQVLRDAHQSLIATRLRTEDMLPICPVMDQIGYFSMEVWGGATFDVCIRYLNEDPWERLKKLKEALPNTPLQMLERAMNIVAYKNFPDDVVEKFIYHAKKDGIDYFRIFDALNDLRNLEKPIKYVKEVGGHAQGSLSYTVSPVHTVERYIEDFKKLESMGCDSLCIKDMAGLVTPKKAYGFIKGAKEAGIKIPIDLHTHCTSGMFGMSYMRACEAGVDILDTSISPFSGGTAQPPTESVVAALRETEYDTGYNLNLLMEARKYFLEVWDKYSYFHKITALRTDPSVTAHQIPGGMLSNLLFQLEQQGAGGKYDEVLAEIPRVRKDFGFPPLVTPTSQIVGIQAVMNVLFGRYKKIPRETKDYVKGMYGKPPGEILEEIYKIILGPNWKDDVIECRPSDLLEPTFDKRKKELEEMGLLKKPEDVLTYAIYPQVGLKFLKGEIKAERLPSVSESVVKRPVFPAPYTIDIDGVRYNVNVKSDYLIEVNGILHNVEIIGEEKTTKEMETRGKGDGKEIEITSPMLGVIIKINVRSGDKVKKGDVIAVLEAMKMENDVLSPADGVVKSVNVSEGKDVEAGNLIAVIQT
ncbi:MAG: pyruvate/oxaloacetate carboxyltransferase [Candidatus Thermoplasmatota archaeon]|nr:pyruvate/oxaloacetate carboxyltransferase [Candidatus Thermoplasmatota archaeon]